MEIMILGMAICKSRCKGEESKVQEEGRWMKEKKKKQIK
jgi:hypothetical protein